MVGCLLAGLIVAGTGLVQQAGAADGRPNVAVPLSKLNSEVYLLRENLNRTMGSLEQLKGAASNNGDLTKPYQAFNSAYEELEKQLASAREHGTAARARAKEHYEAWQKELTEMQNPALREKAQKRFTSASGEFQKIIDRVANAKESFAPLAADLKDINTYLKTDLSTDAVSSLSNTIWKMGHKAKSVDGKLADVNEQIEKTMKKLPQT
jgi:chromosome segregation ATPase